VLLLSALSMCGRVRVPEDYPELKID
jgi:hypothetical protein